jgi:histone acetyltransferase 1
LYGALVRDFLADPIIKEITVEDPNEAFDDLRDYSDLKQLRENDTFERIKINTSVSIPRSGKLPTSEIIDKALLRQQRLRNKIAPRQFDRLVEMHLLSLIPVENRVSSSGAGGWKEYDLWRLLTKQRLYKFNRQSLAQLDLPDRIDKLDDVLEAVENDYVRLLRGLDGGEDEEPDTHDRKAANSKVANRNWSKKRAVEDEEDEDEEEIESDGNDDGDQMEGIERPAKRVKGRR